MDQAQVLDEFRAAKALLEGHFILTSGLRSPMYLQCARVLMDPKRADRLCAALAAKVRATIGENAIDLVVSPAMGGVVVGMKWAANWGCRRSSSSGWMANSPCAGASTFRKAHAA